MTRFCRHALFALALLAAACHGHTMSLDPDAGPSGDGNAAACDAATPHDNVNGSPAPTPTVASTASAADAAGTPTSMPPGVTRGAPMVPIPAADLHRCDLPFYLKGLKPPLCRGAVFHAEPFWIDIREATVGDYQACVDAGACTTTGLDREPTCNWNRARWGYYRRVEHPEEHPINCITWPQASAFCRWAGKRLPMRNEWELGARGPDGLPFSWGDGCRPPEEWSPEIIIRSSLLRSLLNLQWLRLPWRIPQHMSGWGDGP